MMDTATAIAKAQLSLDGLSVGDAFGELFFSISPHARPALTLPPGPWRWTDDTHMALSIVEILKTYGQIEQDALAQAFARRYMEEPYRGYAGGAARLLRQIATGADWRQASPALFGTGSYGNGAAMRAAPIGGYFFGQPERAAQEAQRSAVVTHAHPEGQAGAIAVAVAASLAAAAGYPTGQTFLQEVMAFVPEGLTRQRIRQAIDIPADQLFDAIRLLGSGSQVSAQDTVPFCLWSAAYRLDRFEEALWWTARGMGDCDTTCAIVGGIIALSAQEMPAAWLEQREALPEL
jgi:ADP-ribosylglycohydrolase